MTQSSWVKWGLPLGRRRIHGARPHTQTLPLLISANYPSPNISKLGGLGLPVSFQTFEYGFPNAPKDKRLRGVNVVRS